MKLLVTGGAGFIGSNFIRYWLKHHLNDSVVNFDALTYAGNLDSLVDVKNNAKYSFVHGNILDASEVERAMEDVDIVVHFAAESHVDRSIMDPTIFLKTNALGTLILLEAARKANVCRFHHVSTDEVFGTLPLNSNTKFNEETRYDPHSPYSASKAASDHLVRSYGDTYGLPYTITNCSNNYGPYMFPEKFIPLAITNLMDGKKVPVYGDGKQVRDWLYVEDHCKAIDVVLTHGKPMQTYCVGGLTKDITNVEVTEMVAHYFGKGTEAIEFVKDRPGHDVRYAIDWTKIHKELGWSPSVTFEEGLKKTIVWYHTHEEWWRKLKGESFEAYYKKQYNT